MIIIDTDVLIEIFDKHSTKGKDAFDRLDHAGEDVAITSLTFHEITYGLVKYGKQRIPDVEKLEVIPFTKDDAVLSSRLEQDYEAQGISRIDAMIAAVAINKKARFFTFNKRHFQAIPGLQLM